MAGPNDFDPISRNATEAEAKEMAKNLEYSIEQARDAIVGSSKVFDNQVKLFREMKERLEVESEELKASGRDVFAKQQEVRAESKKLEIAVRAKDGYDALGVILEDVKGLISKARSTKKSVAELAGKPLQDALSALGEVLKKEDVDKFREIFGKEIPGDAKGATAATEELLKAFAALGFEGPTLIAMLETLGIKMYSLADKEVREINNQTRILLERFTGLKSEGKSFFQLLANNGKPGLDAVASSMKAILTPVNLMTLGMTKLFGITKKLVVELDELYAGYAKMGGLIEKDRGGIMGGAIEGSISQNRGLGIGKETSFAAGAGLQESYSQFSTLNEGASADLMALAARFEVVGVSAQTFGKLMTVMTKQFGHSVEESKAVISDMEEYGRSIGVTSSKMMNDMLAAMDILSMFGEKSKQIFRELAKEAKQTGIEVATLVGLEEKFSTFDNAADLAGKLNAMAGRIVLDPMQLMMATGSEKKALMKQAAQAMAIDPNNARSVKYAANAFGISPAEFQKLIAPEDDTERQATSLQKVIEMSLSMGQKLKVVFENFAVAAYPILFILEKAVTWLAMLTAHLDSVGGKIGMVVFVSILFVKKFSLLIGLFKGLAGGVVGLFRAFTGLGKAAAEAAETVTVTAHTTALTANTAALAANATAVTANAAAVAAAGTAGASMAAVGPAAGSGLAAFAAGLLTFALAALTFAAAVAVIALAFIGFSFGITLLVKASNEATLGQMAALGLGLVILGAAFIVFAAEMMIASAFVAFGIPAFVALTGLLAVLATTVPAVAPLMSTFAAGLKDLGSAFRDFMGSMVMETGSGVWNAIKGFFGMKSSGSGLGVFIMTMGILKDTLGGMPEGALDAFSSFLKTISTFAYNASPFASMIASIKEMIGLLKSLPEEKLFSLTTNMQMLGEASVNASEFRGVLEAVGNITSEKVSMVKDVVNTAKDYYSSTNEFAAQQSVVPKKQEEQRVTLEIDGREVADAIIPLIEGRLAASYFQDTLYK